MNQAKWAGPLMPGTGRYFEVKWFKRYLIGCLIALFVLAGVDGYYRPGQNAREGAIIVAAVGWPVVTAMVMGSTVGEIVHDIKQGK